MNVGTRINGALAQTNNSGINIVEKYCYGDDEANCTANDNGGLYQWEEAMGYTNVDGSRGICPAGSHIPTDNEWKILEISQGMAPGISDQTGWRGNDEGQNYGPEEALG